MERNSHIFLSCNPKLKQNKKQAQKPVRQTKLAGVAGLEPTHDGIKIRCLTDLAIPLNPTNGMLPYFIYNFK